jgi:quercetin dioxygenase-like cupin family protein
MLVSVAAEPTSPTAGKAPPSKITVQKFDQVPVQEHPWGAMRWIINADVDPEAEMTFGVVDIKPRQSNPMHTHPGVAEYLHVLSGSCEQRVGDAWVTMKAGDTIRIPPGVPHMARTGEEPCRVVVVYNAGRRTFVVVEEKP